MFHSHASKPEYSDKKCKKNKINVNASFKKVSTIFPVEVEIILNSSTIFVHRPQILNRDLNLSLLNVIVYSIPDLANVCTLFQSLHPNILDCDAGKILHSPLGSVFIYLSLVYGLFPCL